MHIDLELQFLLKNFNYVTKNYIIVGSFGMSSAIESGFPRGGLKKRSGCIMSRCPISDVLSLDSKEPVCRITSWRCVLF